MKLIASSEWMRSNQSFGPTRRLRLPVDLFVIHHAPERAVRVDASPEEEIKELRSIHDYHRRPNPAGITSGFAYNVAATPAGRIYEGRGFTRQGAHAGAINPRSLGILCLWDGSKEFPASGVAALSQLAAFLVENNALTRDWRTDFHRNYRATSCPGDALVRQLHELEQADPSIARPEGPYVGMRVWSDFFNEHLIVTRYRSDEDWSFLRESTLDHVPSMKAFTPLSQMPEAR